MLGGKVLGNSTPKRIVKLLLEVIRKKLTTQPVLRPSLSWDTYIKVSKRVFITSSTTDIPTSIIMKVSIPFVYSQRKLEDEFDSILFL